MTKDEYDMFISGKDKLLEQLRNSLNRETLTSDLNEIDEVQKWFIDSLEHGLPSEALKEQLSMYYGESYIKHLGGEWFYCDDPNLFDYQHAIIINFFNFDGVPLFPLGQVNADIKNREIGSVTETIHFSINKDDFMRDLDEQFRNLK